MSGQSASLVEGRPFRAVLPALASDGRPPAPPPAPVRPLERCYAPRPDVSEFTLFPSKEDSNIFTPADASRIAPQPDYITYQ